MSKSSILNLPHFIERTTMYVDPVNKDTVTSFIDGYECALADKGFTKNIQSRLSEYYKVEYSSDGWPGQIKRWAESNNLSWIEAFRKVASELNAPEN